MPYSLLTDASIPLGGAVDPLFQRAEMYLTLPGEHSPRSLSSPGSEHQKAAQQEKNHFTSNSTWQK